MYTSFRKRVVSGLWDTLRRSTLLRFHVRSAVYVVVWMMVLGWLTSVNVHALRVDHAGVGCSLQQRALLAQTWRCHKQNLLTAE